MAAKRDSAVVSVGMVVAVVAVVVGKATGATPSATTGRCKSGDKGISSNVPSPSNSSVRFGSRVGFCGVDSVASAGGGA